MTFTELLPHLLATLGVVAVIELGIAFLMRAPRELGERHDD